MKRFYKKRDETARITLRLKISTYRRLILQAQAYDMSLNDTISLFINRGLIYEENYKKNAIIRSQKKINSMQEPEPEPKEISDEQFKETMEFFDNI